MGERDAHEAANAARRQIAARCWRGSEGSMNRRAVVAGALLALLKCIRQAIVALTPGINGAGNALAAAIPSGVTLGVGSANETQIQSQAITLSTATAKV